MAQDRRGWGVGSGEWGVGSKEITSPLPIPHSPFPVFSTAAARVVSRVPVVDCENSTSSDHREARSGLGHRTDVDQGEYPVAAQRQQVAHAVRVPLAGKEESAAAAPDDLVIAGAGVELQKAAAAVVLNTDIEAGTARKAADRDAQNGFSEAADGADERRRSGHQIDGVKLRSIGALRGK